MIAWWCAPSLAAAEYARSMAFYVLQTDSVLWRLPIGARYSMRELIRANFSDRKTDSARPIQARDGHGARRVFSAMSEPHCSSGFSLIELMAVLAILAVLAAAAFPMARLATQHSKEQDLRYSLRQLREGIDAYKRASDEGRIPKKVGESGYPKSLDELVNGIEDPRDPNMNKAKIYFMRRIPRDPMAATGIAAAESWGKRSYASPPDDPREGDDVFDVFSRSESIGLNGISYRQW